MGLTLGVESSPKNPPSFTPVLNKLSLQCPIMFLLDPGLIIVIARILTDSLITMFFRIQLIHIPSKVFVDVDDGVVDVHVRADVDVVSVT